MALPRNKNLLGHARTLRKEMTKEERHLWYDFLRRHPLKFYRQKTIGDYIVDFYCDRAKLVIELDGSQHYEPPRSTARPRKNASFGNHGNPCDPLFQSRCDTKF